ncbi:hypothetical protein O181_125548, partial [Austropuccinia psidii MF-1]|nr:hypothetical protein [Austropuccinia psidii MF-1]
MKMVHTRNGSNYSVKQDGSGQGRGNTRTRYGRPSLRKENLEDFRVAPHSSRSVPTTFEINSGPELIQSNVSRVEPLPSVSHRNISVTVRNWYRAAKEDEWEIFPSIWQGDMKSYLHIKSFMGQEKTIVLLGGWSPFSFKEKVKKINNWLNKQSLLSIDQKKELETTPALNKEGPVVSTSSKTAPNQHKDKPKGPEKKQRGPRNNQGKGKGKANWHRLYPKGYKIPKLIPSAMENVFNMDGTLMELTAKKQ